MKHNGRIWAQTSGNFLFLRARGPWNENNIKRFHQAFRKESDIPRTDCWGSLSILCGESVMTPAAVESFEISHKIFAKKGLRFISIVLEDHATSAMAKHQLSRIYQTCGISYGFFDTPEDASKWLRQNGINVDESIIDISPEDKFW